MDHPLSLAGAPMDAFHVCAFFDSRDLEYDVLTPFYIQGFENGEKNIHIIDPALIDDHRLRLQRAGVDVAHCEACGQLEIASWPKAYFDGDGRFDKDRMLGMIDRMTAATREAGFTRLRIMGNMDWAFQDGPAKTDLILYESEVNEVLERNCQPAICVYDMAKLSGATLMDVLRTHPLTLINGVVQENPFFTRPSDMMKEIEARKARAAA
ncbi:MEDS domain-containing protein [Robbsia sp. KACC 23696]|uniref:MEDS domain-containing protein n=1 Tax=Robbsia sp. KACC 23696 TaxID=3149231 RepID=UPI00325AE80E